MGNQPVPGPPPHGGAPQGYPPHPAMRRPPRPERRSIFGDRSAMMIPMLWIAGIFVGAVAVLMVVMTLFFAVSPHHSANTGPAPVIGSPPATTQTGVPTQPQTGVSIPPQTGVSIAPQPSALSTAVAPPTPCFPLQAGC